MTHTAMTFDDEFGKYWTRMVSWVRDNWETVKYRAENYPDFSLPFGTFDRLGVIFGDDGEGEFVTIGFILPDDCYAEIEDGTYGQLQGIRIYKESE